MRRWMVIPLLLALAGSACGWGNGGRKHKGRRDVRPFDQPGAQRLAPGQVPVGSPKLPAELVGKPTRAELPDDEPGLVVLVVMDTVRADHTSLCGYARPTTPALRALAADAHSAHTCHAYAPATWTLPTHASLFTGLDPTEHALLGKGIALPEAATTLAEDFAARGFQTVAVSGNPILKPPTGLLQGFQHTEVAPGMVSGLRGAGLGRGLREVLQRLDPTRPLFVFVNVYDAHDPYAPVPAGLDWVGAQPAVSFRERVKVPDPTYLAFRHGELGEVEQAAYLRRLTDGYDHGVSVADRSVGKVVRLLAKQGWADHGVRLVVTSDHGENLGEHGRLRHDGPPFESVARVPVLVHDSTRPPLALPQPLSVTGLHHVLLHGALPEVPPPVRSASVDYGGGLDPWFEDSVAQWPSVQAKWMSWQGRRIALDLAGDPDERAPLPAGPEAAEALAGLEAWLREGKERARAAATGSPELGALLEDLGYVEPAP